MFACNESGTLRIPVRTTVMGNDWLEDDAFVAVAHDDSGRTLGRLVFTKYRPTATLEVTGVGADGLVVTLSSPATPSRWAQLTGAQRLLARMVDDGVGVCRTVVSRMGADGQAREIADGTVELLMRYVGPAGRLLAE